MNRLRSSEKATWWHWLRGVFWLFIFFTCLRMWLGPGPVLPQAQAQIPDSGLQRKVLIEEARKTNQLLSDIKRLLEQGTLNVRMQGADNSVDGPAGGDGQR